MIDESGWRPSGAPYDLANPDRFAVVHFWASWNRNDRAMDSTLKRLSDLFDESLPLRSCDLDRVENRPLVEQARVLNVPALAIVIRGVPHETITGLRSETELRSRLEEWRARTVGVRTSGWTVDPSKWDPDREAKGWIGDELVPSPDNAFAAMIYSYSEFSFCKMAGHLVVLEAPAANPKVIFHPPGFRCAVSFPSIRWLDSTTCVVSVCSGFLGRAYLNMHERTVGFERGREPLSGSPKRFFLGDVREVPAGLPWYSWEWIERHWQDGYSRRRLPLSAAVKPRNPTIWRRLLGGW